MNTQDNNVFNKSMLQLMAEEMPRDAWPSEASHAVCAPAGKRSLSKEKVHFSNGIPSKDEGDGGWTSFRNPHSLLKSCDWTLDVFDLSAIPYDWQSALISKQDFLMAKAMTSTKEKQGMVNSKQRKQGEYIIISELSYHEKWQFINDCGNDGADLHPAFIYDSDEGYVIQWDYDDKLELWRGLSSLRQGDMQMDTEDVTHQYKANGGEYIHTMTELIQALAEESKKDPEGYALQFEWQGGFSGNWYSSEYPDKLFAMMGFGWPVRRKAQTFDVNIQKMPKHVALDCEVTDVNGSMTIDILYKSFEDAAKAQKLIEQGFGQINE